MTRMTGGQALARSLLREGVRTVFGIPGAGQYEAVDALWETPEVRYVSVRHEQAATYMADGYARAGGGIAAAIVVPGPGVFNALAGMATADDLSSPMLVITGDGNFRDEWPDEAGWFEPLARWTARIERPAGVPDAVQEAMRRMKKGRPGPVLLQVAVGDPGRRGGRRAAGAGSLRARPGRPGPCPAGRAAAPGLEVPDDMGRRRRARLRRLRCPARPGGAPPGARGDVGQRQGRHLRPPSPVAGAGGATLRAAARMDSTAGRGPGRRHEDRVRRPAARPESRSHRRRPRPDGDRRPRRRDHGRRHGDARGAAPRAARIAAPATTGAAKRPPTWPPYGRTGSRRTTSSSPSAR